MATKATPARKTTTSSTATAPKKEETVETKVELPIIEKKEPKKYEPNDLIPCHSMYAGCLLYSGDKSHITYEFSNIGDFRYIEYQDLLAGMLTRKKSLFAPYIIIDDEELLEQPHWSQIKEIYNGLYTRDDLMRIINLPTSKFSEEFRLLPVGYQKNIATIVSGMISDGTFDSMNKIRIIDEVCGTDMAVLFK